MRKGTLHNIILGNSRYFFGVLLSRTGSLPTAGSRRLSIFEYVRSGGRGRLSLFFFLSFLLFSCTSDEDSTSTNRMPITFSCSDSEVMTRSGDVSLSEYITDFKVYGVNGDISGSGDDATFIKKNTVFPNYQVWHTENMANTTSTNTSNWEYVGTVEGAMGSEEQVIKYWDDKHDGHYFWAIGDFSQSGGYTYTESAIPNPHVIEIDNLTQEKIQDDKQCLYFTKPKYVPKSEYGQPVKLTFMRYCSRIRIGFYEDIAQHHEGDKQMKVIAVNFYKVKADGTFNTNEIPTPNVSLKGDFVNSGKVRLTYTNASFKGGSNVDDVATETIPAESGKVNNMNFGVLNIAGTQSGALPTFSSQALFTTTSNGEQYTKVMPHNNEDGLTLQCDILVRNQNESQYTQQYVMASIPAYYTNWQPNQSYTYIFKIVTTPDGAAIILANVEVEGWKSDGEAEAEWHNW